MEAIIWGRQQTEDRGETGMAKKTIPVDKAITPNGKSEKKPVVSSRSKTEKAL
jgi:hypothetical protein